MNSLEKNSKNINDNKAHRIWVPMHVLSNMELILTIKDTNILLEFLTIFQNELSKTKLRMKIIFSEDTQIIDTFNNEYSYLKEDIISKIKFEYYLLYDVASDDAKKRNKKNNKNNE